MNKILFFVTQFKKKCCCKSLMDTLRSITTIAAGFVLGAAALYHSSTECTDHNLGHRILGMSATGYLVEQEHAYYRLMTESKDLPANVLSTEKESIEHRVKEAVEHLDCEKRQNNISIFGFLGGIGLIIFGGYSIRQKKMESSRDNESDNERLVGEAIDRLRLRHPTGQSGPRYERL